MNLPSRLAWVALVFAACSGDRKPVRLAASASVDDVLDAVPETSAFCLRIGSIDTLRRLDPCAVQAVARSLGRMLDEPDKEVLALFDIVEQIGAFEASGEIDLEEPRVGVVLRIRADAVAPTLPVKLGFSKANAPKRWTSGRAEVELVWLPELRVAIAAEHGETLEAALATIDRRSKSFAASPLADPRPKGGLWFVADLARLAPSVKLPTRGETRLPLYRAPLFGAVKVHCTTGSNEFAGRLHLAGRQRVEIVLVDLARVLHRRARRGGRHERAGRAALVGPAPRTREARAARASAARVLVPGLARAALKRGESAQSGRQGEFREGTGRRSSSRKRYEWLEGRKTISGPRRVQFKVPRQGGPAVRAGRGPPHAAARRDRATNFRSKSRTRLTNKSSRKMAMAA